jgi:hypothetical protein
MTAIVGVEPGYAERCSGESPDHSAYRVCRRPSRWTQWSGSRLFHRRPIGVNEDRGDAGLHTNTGDARRELCPKGISDRPTARARAEGQPGQQTPVVVTDLT